MLPNGIEDALSGVYGNFWYDALVSEFDSIESHGTLKVVKRDGQKTATSRIVFAVKTDEAGYVTRFKTRLVLRGFTQVKGLDHEETLSPVPRLTTFRLLIALSVANDWKRTHWDVKTAFLHGEMDHPLFIEVPKHWDQFMKASVTDDDILQVIMGLYGAKQAARIWNQKFVKIAIAAGLKQHVGDPGVFSKTIEGVLVLIIIWVDDVFGFCKIASLLEELYVEFSRQVEMKNLGKLKVAIGIQIEEAENRVVLHQDRYIQEKVEEFRVQDAAPTRLPFAPGKVLVKNDGLLPNVPFLALTGSLGYALW